MFGESDIYLADAGNHLIKFVDGNSGATRTLAGTGAKGMLDGVGELASFYKPSAVAISEDGETLYIADTNNHAIRRMSTSTYEVDTIWSVRSSYQAELATNAGNVSGIWSPMGLAIWPESAAAVSYTHLTLPTILLV